MPLAICNCRGGGEPCSVSACDVPGPVLGVSSPPMSALDAAGSEGLRADQTASYSWSHFRRECCCFVIRLFAASGARLVPAGRQLSASSAQPDLTSLNANPGLALATEGKSQGRKQCRA